MPDDRRKTYPMMATTHWWSLRKRFRGAIPREVTPTYLASALGMNENSAKTNIMPSLRATSIIDKDGKPTDRAVRWRDDAQYAAVCEEIRNSTYPQELLDLAPDASAGRQVIQSWFANHTGAGESGAQKMTSFYVMLLEADPNKQSDAGNGGGAAAKSPARPARSTPARSARRAPVTPPSTEPEGAKSEEIAKQVAEQPPRRKQPDLHINVQIHISSEASAEQVEQIFASMAKHLKDLT